ncbi:alpha/beta hydrolase [Mycobacterium sp. 29Ha]|nr:alpha/beta hydrolase [Mycobacterium sp. 29Ha]
MLLDDSSLFARRRRTAEASVELQEFRGQIHVFQTLFRLLPEALKRSIPCQRGAVALATVC